VPEIGEANNLPSMHDSDDKDP